MNAWNEIAGLLDQASKQPSTETLGVALTTGVQLGALWCGLFTPGNPEPVCVLEQPPGTGWRLDRTIRSALAEAWEVGTEQRCLLSGKSSIPLQVYVVPFADRPYALACVAPSKVLDQPFWQVLMRLPGLMLQQENLLRELESIRTQSEKRLQEVATLYETAMAIERYGINRFLSIITERAAQVMEAQACSLLLRSPDKPLLTIGASYGLPPELVEEVQVPLGEGIAGRVALSGEPLRITDPNLEPSLKGIVARPEISSSICVPLKTPDFGMRSAGLGKDKNPTPNTQYPTPEIFGVLTIRRLRPAPPFSEEEMRLFLIFASQVALALTNARLYAELSRRVGELSTLVDLTQAVNSTLDIEHLLALIADQIVEAVGFERCALFLPGDPTQVYLPRFLRGYHAGSFNPRGFRLGQGVVGLVAKKGMPLVVENARQEIEPLRSFGRMIGANSYVVLPIQVRGQTIGVVLADNRGAGKTIHPEQVELLTAFVNQAGIALENARLYRVAQQQSREYQNLASYLDNILLSMGAGIFTVNREGIVITWNQGAQAMTQLSPREVRGKHYQEIFIPLLQPEEGERAKAKGEGASSPTPYTLHPKSDEGTALIVETIEQVLYGGGARTLYKLLCHWRGERRYLNLTLTPLQDREGTMQGVVVIFEDVTQQVQMEEQMSQMARLAEIGQMTATIAHELRNPMTAIKGASQLLSQEQIPPTAESYIEIILEEVAKLTQIADEFLEFAKPLTLVRKTVDLDRLIQHTVRVFEPYFAEHQIEIRLELEEPPPIQADPDRIEQVLHNLIQNALQAMPKGGTLTLRTGVQGDKAWFAVQDSGEGIPKAILNQIFNPFFTTRIKGTGLGLSIVKKIIESHNGTIEVQSNSPEGAVFIVSLPFK